MSALYLVLRVYHGITFVLILPSEKVSVNSSFGNVFEILLLFQDSFYCCCVQWNQAKVMKICFYILDSLFPAISAQVFCVILKRVASMRSHYHQTRIFVVLTTKLNVDKLDLCVKTVSCSYRTMISSK